MTTPGSFHFDNPAVLDLARRHGIEPAGSVELNDMGLDFLAAFLRDESGLDWVLRIPRRPDVLPRAENESRALKLLRGRLPVDVPDWRVHTPELIAYPRLPGTTALTLDPVARGPVWHIDPKSEVFVTSYAQALAALHAIDPAEAEQAGLRVSTPEQARRSQAADLDRVKREVGVGDDLWRRWQAWLDDDSSWPTFTTLVHGDIYVAHVVVDESARATGFIDWTEAEVNDPSIDLTSHLLAFGEDGLDRLLAEYESAGGRTWPRARSHVAERLSTAPARYALYALNNNLPEHLEAARTQLGLAQG